MDKCLIFSNLELPHFRLQDMKIMPLIQLREMISKALSGQTNLSKSFQSFFIETMELILTHTGRLNFTQLARCGRSCESRFRQNFKKSFDWLSFNRSFLESTKGHRIAIAIDPCYISKSGKKTPGIDWFWSGCAAAMKKGLEIFGISIVDADAKDSVFLKAEQTFTDKKRGRKPDCTKGMKDPDSLTGWYLRMLNRNCKQLLSICKLIVADAYFSKESFVSGEKQGSSVVCLQRLAHFRQPCQGICPSARYESFGRFNQNPAEQRCNGGTINCNVRKISEHVIK